MTSPKRTTGIDLFDVQTRLTPALLVAAPLLSCVYAIFRIDSAALAALAGAAAVGLVALLASQARDAGKAAEKRLLKRWKGWPTEHLIRHSGPGNPVIRAKRRDQLERLVGTSLPTAAEEANDPSGSRDRNDAAIDELIVAARGHKESRLVRIELRHYNFARNLFGLRPYGVVAAAASVLATGAWGVWRDWTVELGFACALSTFILASWILFIREPWVRRTADTYAARLLQCLDSLTTPKAET